MIRSCICLFLAFLLCAAQNAPATSATVWTDLHQTDFDAGTYIISTSGYYRLAEDINFNAKAPADTNAAYGSYYLTSSDFASGGGKYDDQVFQIGFWAAIAIQADNVTLNLNGRTIGQHQQHNVMNRFFTVVELGSQPFLPNQGFHNFGSNRTSANGITIQNGRIYRTATYGIHGIDNSYVLIENVEFREFEVSAVSLQAVNVVSITGCVASTASDVKVNGYWNTALNLRPFIDNLASSSPNFAITVGGQSMTASSLQAELTALVNYVFARVNGGGALDEPSSGDVQRRANYLFNNDFRRPDGECFAFSVSARNALTGGFPIGSTSANPGSSQVNISHCDVQTIECATTESVAIATTAAGGRLFPVLDTRGRVFSLLRKQGWDLTDPKKTLEANNDAGSTWLNLQLDEPENLGSAKYTVGNTVANIQALIGKAVLQGVFGNGTSGLQLTKSSFNNDLITWIESGTRLETYFNGALLTLGERSFICNSGEDYTVQSGVGAYRVMSTAGGSISDSTMGTIRNWGNRGAGVCVYTVSSRSNPNPSSVGYNGADARGIVVASVSDFYLTNVYAEGLSSHWGSIYVFDVMTDSNFVYWMGSEMFIATGGEWVTSDMTYENNPTRFPVAIAFHIDSRSQNVTLYPYCVNQLSAPGGGFKLSSGPNVTDMGEYEGCHVGKVPWWIWLLLAVVALIFIVALVAVIMACFEVKKEENSYSEMK